MRRVFSISVLLFLFLLSAGLVQAQEQIRSFQTVVTVSPDATVAVEEKILYDFGSQSRHGIYRNIPVVNTNIDGKKFEVDFSFGGVTQDFGDKNPLEVPVSLERDGEMMNMRIGDADSYVTGQVLYDIQYQMRGAITYFSDHDELYWNVTGNQWEIPIQSSEFRIQNSELTENAKFVCYTGFVGSTAQDCTIGFDEEADQHVISSNTPLSPGEGLTIAMSFPKGLVAVVEPREYGKLTTGQIIFFLLLAAVACVYYILSPFYLVWRWWRAGRDPYTDAQGKSIKNVTAWFEPPKNKEGRILLPAEVGGLVDEHVDMRDITASIVRLAVDGYLTIKELPKKLLRKQENEFIKHSKPKTARTLELFERELLDGLFKSGDTVTTTELSKTFYTTVTKVQKSVYESLEGGGFFPHNPDSVRTKYTVLGVIALFTGNFILAAFAFTFGRNMVRKTLFGAESAAVGRGLKNFLS